MTDSTSRPPAPDEDAATAAARERLEVVLDGFNGLTPDELARIGLRRRDPALLDAMLQTATRAARDAGRSELLADGRRQARDTILRRYQHGVLHPTFLMLNWGISQGTTEDRVAIIDALQDAATAAVVADLVDPGVTDALAADGAEILGLAGGMAYEGSLDRALRPAAPGYADGRYRWGKVFGSALMVGVVAAGIGSTAALIPVALIAGAGFAFVVRRNARSSTRGAPPIDDTARSEP